MARTKGIERGFAALGKSGQTVLLAQRFNPVAATGQYLVWIGLMTNVPDHPVMRCIENVMQRHCKFYNTKSGTKMTAGFRDRANSGIAQLACQALQIPFGKTSQIINRSNAV